MVLCVSYYWVLSFNPGLWGHFDSSLLSLCGFISPVSQENHLKVREFLHLILSTKAAPNFLRLSIGTRPWGWGGGCRPLEAIVPRAANHRVSVCRLCSINGGTRRKQHTHSSLDFSDRISWTVQTTSMQSPGKSLKEALLCAQSEDRLTVGVYESAKIMTE